MIEPWGTRDVTDWSIQYPDPRGKRTKYWVRAPDGSLWLRKEPREQRPTEPAVEALILRLARGVGLSASESFACTWRDDEAIKRGIAVRMFTDRDRGEELSIGSVELRAVDLTYDSERRGLHTLARVYRALESLEAQSGISALEPFTHMLAFDAWVGNADRHQENWGVIRANGLPKCLAPMFDPAACLGVELLFGHPYLEPDANLNDYINKCPSGFGDGTRDRPLLPMVEVVRAASAWPQWRACAHMWLAAFEGSMDTFEGLVRCVPPDWLPEVRGAFACKLLRRRLEWLRQRCG